jgi:hypothetical protein
MVQEIKWPMYYSNSTFIVFFRVPGEVVIQSHYCLESGLSWGDSTVGDSFLVVWKLFWVICGLSEPFRLFAFCLTRKSRSLMCRFLWTFVFIWTNYGFCHLWQGSLICLRMKSGCLFYSLGRILADWSLKRN